MSSGGCLMGLGSFLVSVGMSVGCWVEESSPEQSWEVGCGRCQSLTALGTGMCVVPMLGTEDLGALSPIPCSELWLPLSSRILASMGA